jgi:hypothetical protein
VTLAMAEKRVQVMKITVTGVGSWGEGQIKWEAERATDSSDTPNDISAINDAAVPCVFTALGSLREHIVGAAFISCNGEAAVKESKVSFDGNGLVITFAGGVEPNLQHLAHGLEGGAEVAPRIYDNEAA